MDHSNNMNATTDDELQTKTWEQSLEEALNPQPTEPELLPEYDDPFRPMDASHPLFVPHYEENTNVNNEYTQYTDMKPAPQTDAIVKYNPYTDVMPAPQPDIIGNAELFSIPSNIPAAITASEYTFGDELFASLPVNDLHAIPSVYSDNQPEFIFNVDQPEPVASSIINPGFVADPDNFSSETPSSNLTSVPLYRNKILNLFADPITPLGIIDSLHFPFAEELQGALERELRRQQASDDFRSGRSGGNSGLHSLQPSYQNSAVTSGVSTPELELGPGGKIPGNKRSLHISNFDPTEFYVPLAIRPQAWGSINPATGEPTFKYTKFGELEPMFALTVDQMREYIGHHPLHQPSVSRKDSTLQLLIQTVPADSGKRYANQVSNKCRFADCTEPQHTIRKGDFRVCFNEQPLAGIQLDPYHNAGFVHLFCLEKHLDFPQICKDFNVQADTRVFREGRNKMAVTRDHASMEDIVNQFITSSLPWKDFGPNGMRPHKYYPYTLNFQLTVHHLDKQPKHLQKIREQRMGNSIDVHLNNLDVYADNNRIRKEEQVFAAGKEGSKTRQKRRRSSVVEREDEGNVLDGDVLDLERIRKRPRRSY